ncbi:hypothetical protein KY284_020401 [Solanum tuberosum]|nr:hypothetical protein KY284_020401 [Solanum tuberosum]
MSKHLVKKYETQKQKLAKPEKSSHLDHYELHLSINKFKIHSTREAWAKAFHDIKEGNFQWMFQDFMSEKIVVRGALCPFLILPGIRGVRPYNPSRVMQQFGRKQILPMKGDTSRYVIDYNGCDKIPHAEEILHEWGGSVNLKESMAENRYEAGYVDGYKKWLQDDLLGTLDPTPCTGRQIEDVQVREQEFQHREFESQRAVSFVTHELANTRVCLMCLDSNLDDQLDTLRGVSMSSKAVFAEPHVVTSKFLIREEVEKLRGGAGPSAF